MLHKAWNSKEEMPYCFPRSSVNFQGHTVKNITDFDPNWAFPDYRPVAAFKSLRFALLCVYEFRFINNWFEICNNNQSYTLIDITYFKPIINESEVWLHHSLYLADNWGNYATKLVSKSSGKMTFCQLYLFMKTKCLILFQNIPWQWFNLFCNYLNRNEIKPLYPVWCIQYITIQGAKLYSM